jgi:hypothetical protein
MQYESELISIYLDKLQEVFEDEGYPRILVFETNSGETVSYSLEDDTDLAIYEDYDL